MKSIFTFNNKKIPSNASMNESIPEDHDGNPGAGVGALIKTLSGLSVESEKPSLNKNMSATSMMSITEGSSVDNYPVRQPFTKTSSMTYGEEQNYQRQRPLSAIKKGARGALGPQDLFNDINVSNESMMSIGAISNSSFPMQPYAQGRNLDS